MGIIYKVTNILNNKIYIGKTTKSLLQRKQGHLAGVYYGSNYYFHRAIRKYGEENFIWETIYQLIDEKKLNELEKEFIWLYNSNNRNFGYNMTKGGEGISGFKHKKESIEKMRRSKIGKKSSEESIKKRISKIKGRKYSEESKKNMSIAQKGHLVSESQRKNISNTLKGRPQSDETRRKKSIANIGKNVGELSGNYIKINMIELIKDLSIYIENFTDIPINEFELKYRAKWSTIRYKIKQYDINFFKLLKKHNIGRHSYKNMMSRKNNL